ncbi:MAG: Mrp/NBP35 family ATP-binding protein [Bdellovibrionales bacterium]
MAQAPNNPFDQQKPIPGIKNIYVVASGKGGVGKSTVSSNLALALTKEGRSVGLLDADIYGPSLPRMFGALNQKPQMNSQQQIIPLSRYGIKLMSMGFLIDEGAAVVWRGPMLFKAIDQFFRDVDWGELDDLVIDLPPGTGDVQLSIAQKVPIKGAIVVTTPQNVALADVKKSIDMFRRVNIPILGMIENMAYFKNPTTGEKLTMFPQGELNSYLDKEHIPKLGQLPFFQGLAQGAEIGIPFIETHPEDEVALTFKKIAQGLISH